MNTISIDIEKQILSAVLQSETALLTCMENIDGQDFKMIQHQQIYNAAIDVYRDGGGLDISLIYTRTKEVNHEISVLYLSSLYDVFSVTSNIKTYIAKFQSELIRQKVETLSRSILANMEDGVNGESLLAELSSGLIAITEGSKEKTKPDVESIYFEIVDDWKKIERGEKVCIPVNEMVTTSGILGWYPGHLITIGGYTSVGKSTYLAQIVVDACIEGASVLVFSLEDKRTDKLIKVLANITDIPQGKLIAGDFNRDIVQSAWLKIKDYKLLIYDDIYSVEEIALKILKAKMTGNVDIVCIDFIQNITSEGGIYERMSNAIIELQKMAKRFGVTMIVLSQVSNESMRGDSEIIGLKGAGELASASDIVMWLKRVKGEGNEHKLELEIRKNRPFGETGIRRLRFSDRWTRIERG